ncbi:hypothetical protein Q9966_005913 [Columba livia]|nr:hypothetical protein Q9966_005913 [Columba livia]
MSQEPGQKTGFGRPPRRRPCRGETGQKKQKKQQQQQWGSTTASQHNCPPAPQHQPATGEAAQRPGERQELSGDQILEADSVSLRHAAFSEAYGILGECGPGPVSLITSQHPNAKGSMGKMAVADEITTINRIPVSKMTYEEICLLRQCVPTSVTLQIQKASSGDTARDRSLYGLSKPITRTYTMLAQLSGHLREECHIAEVHPVQGPQGDAAQDKYSQAVTGMLKMVHLNLLNGQRGKEQAYARKSTQRVHETSPLAGYISYHVTDKLRSFKRNYYHYEQNWTHEPTSFFFVKERIKSFENLVNFDQLWEPRALIMPDLEKLGGEGFSGLLPLSYFKTELEITPCRALGSPAQSGTAPSAHGGPAESKKDTYFVVLHKEEEAGLGFSVAGQTDPEQKSVTARLYKYAVIVIQKEKEKVNNFSRLEISATGEKYVGSGKDVSAAIGRGGAAEQSGNRETGDEILAVSGKSLLGLVHYDAWNIIKYVPEGPVQLLIRKCRTSM